jgi:arginase
MISPAAAGDVEVAALAIIDVPSNLGLRPSGVEQLPGALRRAGLAERLRARHTGQVEPSAAYDAIRDPETKLLNGPGLRDTAHALADAVATVIARGEVPVVLAGDCSVVLGGLLGLRRAARHETRGTRAGLLFVDGHVDFYQPDASPTGEVADMDLALATGRGPDLLARLDAVGPLVRDEDVAAVGARDADERDNAGSQDVRATGIHLFELDALRRRGMAAVAADALAVVTRPELEAGFWLHLDADVLDDAVMPAVDYRQPGGLAPAELVMLLSAARRTERLAGLSVAIYNPMLDPQGKAAAVLVDCLGAGIGPS